jgi:hypothetical protein
MDDDFSISETCGAEHQPEDHSEIEIYIDRGFSFLAQDIRKVSPESNLPNDSSIYVLGVPDDRIERLIEIPVRKQ